MRLAIRAEGLRKRYAEVEALGGVDLAVPTGTVLGLLGPNGAGKTTTVRILTTLLPPDGGTATVAGFDVVRQPEKVREQIGLAGQYAAVDSRLTGRQNLKLIGVLHGLPRRVAKARADELLERFELSDAAHRETRTYSGGMRRRLDLAASVVADPAVLFLDEPTSGLDPASRQVLWRMIRDYVAGGTTVLLTTQNLDEADELAGQVVVVDSGTVIAAGTPDELKRKVGGERLEVSPAAAADVPLVVSALGRATAGAPVVGADGRSVSVPLTGDVGAIAATAAAAAALNEAGVEVSDFGVRRPTLVEVFLTLTGTTGRAA
ncbi:MAG: ATP-binding cassette domain-containing protein [Mycobacteriales bacterium]